jgi:hypothetical protein
MRNRRQRRRKCPPVGRYERTDQYYILTFGAKLGLALHFELHKAPFRSLEEFCRFGSATSKRSEVKFLLISSGCYRLLAR